jgi:ankyrin repeat protein
MIALVRPDPLARAIWSGNATAVCELIAAGESVHARTLSGRTPLHIAVHFRQPDVIRALLDAGAKPDARDIFMRTPFDSAQRSGPPEIVQLLADARRNNSWLENDPWTIIGLVCALAPLIMFVGINIGRGFSDRPRDLSTPVRAGCAALLVIGSMISLSRGGPLVYAIRRGRVRAVRRWIASGKRSDNRTLFLRTPLHFAALYSQPEILQMLLDHGSSANARDFLGKTPLHLARYRDDKRIARLLMERGANSRTRDWRGRTPDQVGKRHDNRT